ncbi:beta-L-arabinofuranosidase domain-containing protein [Posidoniimonas polymericola]|nr:beta-L-arabinofuranosidase domain-containing protein [Posidoniimonas polymericola]
MRLARVTAVAAPLLAVLFHAPLPCPAADLPVGKHPVGKHPAAKHVIANRAPLQSTPYLRLPIGAVRPEGWLLRQCELQRSGLTGAAERIYDALQSDSGWLGGDGEGWEKGPYYVKGLLALAYTLDDDQLKQRAQKWVDWAIESQRADGFFGPASNDDWWPRMVVLYYLRDYDEQTDDPRVLPFLTRYFQHQLAALPDRPLQDWGRARAGDNIDIVLWTYNQTGDRKLLDLARLLADQAYPWSSIYTDNRFYDFGSDFHPHHIVNVSQALKMPAVAWQLSGAEADRRAFAAGVANLERQYGRVDGQVSGTEMLSGRKSTDGVELCADVERILSNGVALTILGDAELGDQMERVAYNSLPAHTTANMRQLTYYQFPNQVAATRGRHGFEQDYDNANMPGPHSGFPCCCYNWHFGWPKFIQHMWAATEDGGLAALAYGPNRVTLPVNDSDQLTITQQTDYPFGDTITLTIAAPRALTFPLVLRVPAWCEEPSITVNGQPIDGVKPGAFCRVQREWQDGDQVELHLPMKVEASTWANDSVALTRGPLAFSLKIDEAWEKSNDYLDNFDEYEVRPASAWNYALRVNRDAPEVEVLERGVSDTPFATDAAPVTLRVPARRLPDWGMRTQLGRLELGRADNNYQPLAGVDTPLEPGRPHELRVECRGDQIRVFVDNSKRPLIDHRDDSFARGAIGLRAYENRARFDNVRLDGQPIDDWQEFGGEWSSEASEHRVTAKPSGKLLARGEEDLGDVTLEATITAAAGGNAGLMFRVSDPTDRLDGYRGYYVGLSCVAGESEDSEEPPQSPVTSNQPEEIVELIPFGSTKIRVTYFPVLEE